LFYFIFRFITGGKISFENGTFEAYPDTGHKHGRTGYIYCAKKQGVIEKNGSRLLTIAFKNKGNPETVL
jgi:hypothetical protein